MPKFGYSISQYSQPYVKASGREINISHKAAREVCKTINGKMIPQAKAFLESVIEKKHPVPFRRFKNKVGHRKSSFNFHVGRYPVKAADKIFELIENLENNGDFKGMDTERMKIIHASAVKGRKVKSYTPRAFGRSSASHNSLVHIELAATEV